MSILGKPITAPTSGLKPELVVTSTAGSTLTVTENGVTKASYTLGASETQHTFKVPLNSVPNPLAHGLPSGFTEVEYIESTGTQYIDTGATVSKDSSYYARCKIKNTGTGNFTVFGAENSSSDRGFARLQNGSTFQVFAPSVMYPSGFIVGEVNDITVDFKNKKVDLNGTITSIASTPVNTTTNSYIFAMNYHGSANNFATMNYYEYAEYVDGNKIHDYIPCINNTTGKAGMYDLVAETFFGNSGTGDFLYGDIVPRYLPYTVTATNGTRTKSVDVLVDAVAQFEVTVVPSRLPSGFQEVEYIQSSGTQYIDTAVLGDGNIRFECDATMSNAIGTSNVGTLIGARNSSSGGIVVNSYQNFAGGTFAYGTVAGTTNALNAGMTSGTRFQMSFLSDGTTNTFTPASGTASTVPNRTVTNPVNAYLFARHGGSGSTAEIGSCTLYSMKLYNVTTLVREFVPCYNTEVCTGYQGATAVSNVPANTAGLYDIENDRFYINSGTGVFVPGADVN